MSGLAKSPAVRTCAFCGMVTDVSHESQEACIRALHAEIERMKDILASLKPAGVPVTPVAADDDHPAAIRLRLD